MQLRRKQLLAQKRRWRIRKKVRGTSLRPRMVVSFTEKHIYVQCINDTTGSTLAQASTIAKDFRDEKVRPNIKGATRIGQVIAQRALASGITQVVLDRAGRRYHGCVKAFADSARAAGLQF